MSGKTAGTNKERKLKKELEADGWIVYRSAASIGAADLVAMKAGHKPRLIQVKATAGGKYERFQPEERENLKAEGKAAGAEVWLVWWPPNGKQVWVHPVSWPKPKVQL